MRRLAQLLAWHLISQALLNSWHVGGEFLSIHNCKIGSTLEKLVC